jgi:hypothetical protein
MSKKEPNTLVVKADRAEELCLIHCIIAVGMTGALHAPTPQPTAHCHAAHSRMQEEPGVSAGCQALAAVHKNDAVHRASSTPSHLQLAGGCSGIPVCNDGICMVV